MKRIYFSSKIFTLGLFFMVSNLALAQNAYSFSSESFEEAQIAKIDIHAKSVQWIVLNPQPSMSIEGTFFEYWDYNTSDTTMGYISDSVLPFSAPASLYLLGTKIGYYYNEFDYIDEPYYIYNVVVPIRTPEDLTASLECDNVILNWDWEFLGHLPNVNDQFSGFNIYRNDSLLNQEPVQDTFYVDQHVPAGDYEYYVETLFTDGTHSPAYDTVTVEKDYYYGDMVVNAEGMGLEWHLENDINTPSELNQYEVYRDGEFLDSTGSNFWISFYPPQNPHEYCVEAAYVNGCYSKMDCDTLYPAVSNTNLQEDLAPKITPNPANDYVSLEYSKDYDFITITTLSGTECERINIRSEKAPVTVSVADYHQGIYLICWYKDGVRSHTQKLIVDR